MLTLQQTHCPDLFHRQLEKTLDDEVGTRVQADVPIAQRPTKGSPSCPIVMLTKRAHPTSPGFGRACHETDGIEPQ